MITLGAPASGTSLALFQGRATANQFNLTQNAFVPVALQAEDYDPDNGHSTSTNTSRYVAQRAIDVCAGGNAMLPSAQGATLTTRGAAIFKNGVLVPGSKGVANYPNALFTVPTVPIIVSLVANDFLELQVLSSAAASATTGLYGTATDGSVLVIERVG